MDGGGEERSSEGRTSGRPGGQAYRLTMGHKGNRIHNFPGLKFGDSLLRFI